jgi:hypothetical protein
VTTTHGWVLRLGFRVKVRFSHAINYKIFSKLYILKIFLILSLLTISKICTTQRIKVLKNCPLPW